MKKYKVKIEIIKDVYLGVFAGNKIEAEEQVCDMIKNSRFTSVIAPKVHTRYNYIVKKERGKNGTW